MEDSKRKKTNEWNNSDTCTLNWQQKHWTASLVKSMLLKRSLVGFEISYTLTCARVVDKHLGWSSCVYLCRGSLFKPSPCRYMCLRFTAAPMTILNWRSCVQLQLMQNAGSPAQSSPLRPMNENLYTALLITQVLIMLSMFHALKQQTKHQQ